MRRGARLVRTWSETYSALKVSSIASGAAALRVVVDVEQQLAGARAERAEMAEDLEVVQEEKGELEEVNYQYEAQLDALEADIQKSATQKKKKASCSNFINMRLLHH